MNKSGTSEQLILIESILSLTKYEIELRALPSKKKIITRDLKKIKQFIQANINNDLYSGVYTRQNGGKKENVREVVCYFADMDFKDYPRGEAEASERIKNFEFKPTFLIHSGNGFHVYWFLNRIIEPSLKVEAILRGIAKHLVADISVCELARILRIPGTYNYKNGEKKPVSIIEHNDISYNPKVFDQFEDKNDFKNNDLLKDLYRGVPDGQRNVSLARLVGSWVNDGLTFDECLQMAYQWNERNNPPETDNKEIENTVRSIYNKHHRELNKEVEDTKALSEAIAEATTENMPEILKGLAEVKSESERAILIDALSKRLNIGKRFIQNDIKKLSETGKDSLTVYNAHFKGLVDLVLDDDGTVSYLIKNENSLHIEKIWEVNKPPKKTYLPFELPNAKAVISWYESDNDQVLFKDVIAYLKRFSYLTKEQLLIITCKVFLTYIQDHPDIHYLPMILFYAVPERGKTRTGKAAIYISYRGVHCVDLREANLFRFAQDLKATLFIDIMDLWKKAERNGSEDILLLRYERGAKATRVIYPEKGAFKDTVYYSIYGPTFIATNQAIHKILDSRSIPITMPNKPGDYENPTPEKAQELKERLTAWRARAMDISLPEIEHIRELGYALDSRTYYI